MKKTLSVIRFGFLFYPPILLAVLAVVTRTHLLGWISVPVLLMAGIAAMAVYCIKCKILMQAHPTEIPVLLKYL